MTASTHKPQPTEAPPSPAGDAGTGERVAQRRREAAMRASAEAEARRTQAAARAASAKPPIEKGGRDGPDPVRYGDWEVKGIATDF